ncbi:hypothetical protein HS5_02880 [Acidianus sp. HS-5]|nr:hypothetical protein HS5_02880 [Acidianus sp. HS-5]
MELLEKLSKGELKEEDKKELSEKLGRTLNYAEKLMLAQLIGLLKQLEEMVKDVRTP